MVRFHTDGVSITECQGCAEMRGSVNSHQQSMVEDALLAIRLGLLGAVNEDDMITLHCRIAFQCMFGGSGHCGHDSRVAMPVANRLRANSLPQFRRGYQPAAASCRNTALADGCLAWALAAIVALAGAVPLTADAQILPTVKV